MKAAAVLLSLMVILLNAVPCCWDDCTEDATIEHSEGSAGGEDTCSPFLSCGSCTGFVLQQDLPETSCFTSPLGLLDEQEEVSFQSDYSIKIWQPPKKV